MLSRKPRYVGWPVRRSAYQAAGTGQPSLAIFFALSTNQSGYNSFALLKPQNSASLALGLRRLCFISTFKLGNNMPNVSYKVRQYDLRTRIFHDLLFNAWILGTSFTFSISLSSVSNPFASPTLDNCTSVYWSG